MVKRAGKKVKIEPIHGKILIVGKIIKNIFKI